MGLCLGLVTPRFFFVFSTRRVGGTAPMAVRDMDFTAVTAVKRFVFFFFGKRGVYGASTMSGGDFLGETIGVGRGFGRHEIGGGDGHARREDRVARNGAGGPGVGGRSGFADRATSARIWA